MRRQRAIRQERKFAGEGPFDVTLAWCGREGSIRCYPTWRERWAWRLRRFADRLEWRVHATRPSTHSFTLHGKMPKWVTPDVYADAMAYGVSCAMRYLDEFDQEMRVGDEPNPAQGD